MTIPGISAPGSPSPLALRSPVRIFASAVAHEEGGDSALIGAVVINSAATLRSDVITTRPVIEIF